MVCTKVFLSVIRTILAELPRKCYRNRDYPCNCKHAEEAPASRGNIQLRASLTLGLGLTRAMAAGVARELPRGVDNSIAPPLEVAGSRRQQEAATPNYGASPSQL